MLVNLSSISFQGKVRTNTLKNAVLPVTAGIAATTGLLAHQTHYYTPRRSAETVQEDLNKLRLVLLNAAANKETLSRKEVAYRAGITHHQLNNMINKGLIDADTMALYNLVKIKNSEQFKPLPEDITASRITAIKKGIKALSSNDQEITGENIAEITGISVHKVRRMLANNTDGLNTFKKDIKSAKKGKTVNYADNI